MKRKIEIPVAYKFVMGFLLIIFSSVISPYLFSFAHLNPYLEKFVSVFSAILIGGIIGLFVLRGTSFKINSLRELSTSIAKGELNFEPMWKETFFPDEFDDIKYLVDEMKGHLKELIKSLIEISEEVAASAQSLGALSEQVTASSEEVSKTMETIAQGASKQAEEVDKAVKLIQETAKKATEASSLAEIVEKASFRTADSAQKGADLVEKAISKLMNIFESFSQILNKFLEFSTTIEKVKEIIDFITGVSNKINLLALNATIEAARAGESGRGFSVVADEIRKLADNTQKSVKEITQLVDTIAHRTGEISSEMRLARESIEEGRADLNVVVKTFREIQDTALESKSKVEEVTKYIKGQAEISKVLVENIEKISHIAEENASVTEEVTATMEEQTASMSELNRSAQNLADLSVKLKGKVEQFRL